ncbi:MAG: pilus assembly FimT family protein [Planctomycetota bacterium]|jgi:Tfp pilus assembly protein FimT
MKYSKTAFSLIELIIIVAFLGIFAFITVPRLNFAIISKQKADSLARKIVTDLRLTRRLAISDAVNNVKGFELKMVGLLPYGTYEIENVNTHATVASYPIDSDVSVICPTGSRFIFGPLGNLESGSGTSITVSAEGKSFTITFIVATGTIKCVEN